MQHIKLRPDQAAVFKPYAEALDERSADYLEGYAAGYKAATERAKVQRLQEVLQQPPSPDPDYRPIGENYGTRRQRQPAPQKS